MTLQCKRCFLWPVGWNHDIRHFAGHVKKPVNPFLVIFMFQLRNFMLLLCVEGIYLISWSPLKKKTSVDEVWNVRCPFLDSQGFHPTVTIFIFNHCRDEMKHTNTLKPLLAENINDCTYCSIWKHTDNSIVVHWVTHSGPSWQLNRNVEMSPIHQHWLSFLLIVTVTLCSDYIHILHTQI